MIERRDVLNQGSIAEASPSVSTSTVLRASEDTAHENIAHRLDSGTPLWSIQGVEQIDTMLARCHQRVAGKQTGKLYNPYMCIVPGSRYAFVFQSDVDSQHFSRRRRTD